MSYAPAWKVAQAQTMAAFKDWMPFVGLQIEYSLLARTVEDELVAMVQELGLGITPWAPLKGGLLSGKYDPLAENQHPGARMGGTARKVVLSEKEIAILDELGRMADVHHTTVAATDLAWVVSRLGVSATIIGVRKPEQLELNMAALAVKLSGEEISSLNMLSAPPLSFVARLPRSRTYVPPRRH